MSHFTLKLLSSFGEFCLTVVTLIFVLCIPYSFQFKANLLMSFLEERFSWILSHFLSLSTQMQKVTEFLYCSLTFFNVVLIPWQFILPTYFLVRFTILGFFKLVLMYFIYSVVYFVLSQLLFCTFSNLPFF